MIILATSEQYRDDRALEAGVVYPMLIAVMLTAIPYQSRQPLGKHTCYYIAVSVSISRAWVRSAHLTTRCTLPPTV